MCYILYKTKKEDNNSKNYDEILKEIKLIKNELLINNDAYGIAFRSQNGAWEYDKHIFNKTSLVKFEQEKHNCLAKWIKYRESYYEVIIHLRFRTSGPNDINHCHPIDLDNNKLFIHNGVISNMVWDNKKSDTHNIAKYYDDLINIGDGGLLRNLLVNNKLLVLENNKETIIHNIFLGHWVNKTLWQSHPEVKVRNNKYYCFGYDKYELETD